MTLTIDVTANNLGRFTLIAYKATSKAENEIGYTKIGEYPVSFNAGSKDYIYKFYENKSTSEAEGQALADDRQIEELSSYELD